VGVAESVGPSVGMENDMASRGDSPRFQGEGLRAYFRHFPPISTSFCPV
jgi:hypothetical protein